MEDDRRRELRALIARSLDGDIEASGLIVQRFQRLAFACAYAVIEDVQLAEDAAQDAFVTAYRTLPQLADPACFPGWFRRIVSGASHRILRRRDGLRAAALDEVLAVTLQPIEIEEARRRREARRDVLAALEGLSRPLRLATLLHYFGQQSVEDIALFLELPIGTVKYRLHEARRQLRARITDMRNQDICPESLNDVAPEAVLTRLGLGFPPGTMTEAVGGDTLTVFLSTTDAIGSPGASGLLGLTLPKAAAALVSSGPLLPKAVVEAGAKDVEWLDLVCRILRESRAVPDCVILDAPRPRELTARLAFGRGGERIETELPPQIGLALVRRLSLPLYASPRLMGRAVAGLGCTPGFSKQDLIEFKAELLKGRERDQLLDLAWQHGLDPEAGRNCVRIEPDEEHALVRLYIGRRRRPATVADLDSCRGGLLMLRRDATASRRCGRHFRSGKRYGMTVACRGECLTVTYRRLRGG